MRISGPSCKSAPVWIVRRSPSGGVLVRSWARGPTPSLRPGQPAPATAQTGTDPQDGPLRVRPGGRHERPRARRNLARQDDVARAALDRRRGEQAVDDVLQVLGVARSDAADEVLRAGDR